MFQVQKLEEDRINSIHHQEAQKQQQKAWLDKNIGTKHISIDELVLLYDRKIKGKPRKMETTWLGPYIIEDINSEYLNQTSTEFKYDR